MSDPFDEDKNNESPHVCAEIAYRNGKGEGVHSDLCSPDISHWDDSDYRKLLHDSLDEFLNAKDSTGYFYIGSYPNPE